jgi:hypothetical protein
MCSNTGVGPTGPDTPRPPRDLAAAQPSAQVITELVRIDHAGLSPDDRVWLAQAWERAQSWTAAQSAAVVATVESTLPVTPGYVDDDPDRSAAAELSLALQLTENGARLRLDTARALQSTLAPAGHALARGDISYRHVMALAELVAGRTDDIARAVQDRVLARAATQTTSQLRTSIRRALARLDPRTEAHAHQVDREQRRVELFPEPHGMATVRAYLPAEDAQCIWLALDTLARATPAPDQPAPIGARRADALTALAATYLKHPDTPKAHGRPVTVQLVIDLPTLLALTDTPGELIGYGAIPAPAARALALDGTWQRVIVEPHTGRLLDLGTTRYRPNQALRDYILTRDRTCTFPPCQTRAARCDIDHLQPYQPHDPGGGGPTDEANLRPPCRRHHILKTHYDWTTHTDPDGTVIWTDPAGRQHRNPPTDHRPGYG